MSLWVVLVMAAFAAGVLLGRKRKAPSLTSPASTVIAESSIQTTTVDEGLSSKLHGLAQKIEEFITGSSHPRELTERSEFGAAVDLLCNTDVNVETVVQYATGANANLACAAFAALARRPDRNEPVATIVPRLGNIWPYPMYFALLYLDALAERPPLGLPFRQLQQWWARNPILIAIFTEYLDRREKSGDTTGFGETKWSGEDPCRRD